MSNDLIAITGGSGFVGSHVVDALLGAGYAVRVIDPKPPAQAEAEWADVDMLDQDSVTDALKNAYAVFHLAAMADVNDIVADPAESVALNTLGVARVLEGAMRADRRDARRVPADHHPDPFAAVQVQLRTQPAFRAFLPGTGP